MASKRVILHCDATNVCFMSSSRQIPFYQTTHDGPKRQYTRRPSYQLRMFLASRGNKLNSMHTPKLSKSPASARGKKRSNIRVISFPQIETWLCISGILAKPKRRGHRAVIYYYYRLPKRLINETSTRVCQIGFSVSPIHRPDAWPI